METAGNRDSMPMGAITFALTGQTDDAELLIYEMTQQFPTDTHISIGLDSARRSHDRAAERQPRNRPRSVDQRGALREVELDHDLCPG